MAWHPSDRLFAAQENAPSELILGNEVTMARGNLQHTAADQPATGEPTSPPQPHACSYCGGTNFGQLNDTGRGANIQCQDCGGTMTSWGGQWSPELVGDPSNHPSPGGDPRASYGTGNNYLNHPDGFRMFPSEEEANSKLAFSLFEVTAGERPTVTNAPDDHDATPDATLVGPEPKKYRWTQTYQTANGYEDRESEIEGPLYHGGRARLSPGDHITPGRKPNSWGDEGPKSTHVYFTSRPDTAASYADALGNRGRIYEVEPTGSFKTDYSSGDYKTPHPLRVVREVPRQEWQRYGTKKSWGSVKDVAGSHVFRGVHGPANHEGGDPEAGRGERARAAAESTRQGKPGTGVWGDGTYTIATHGLAIAYAQAHSADNTGVVLHGQIDPHANVGHVDWAPSTMEHRSRADWARQQGHDVLTNGHMHVILNPSAVRWEPKNYGALEAHHRFDEFGDHYAPPEELFPEHARRTGAVRAGRGGPMGWDDIGQHYPQLYGDLEIHGEAAEGSDGWGIGDAANHLAHDHPGDPGAESSSVHDLQFHPMHVEPKHIDYARHGGDDQRVRHAREGYETHPNAVPPLVLVHRHGVFQVADGHHRAEGARLAGQPVRAFVAFSPHPDTPFSSEEDPRAPFHGHAEPIHNAHPDHPLHHYTFDNYGSEVEATAPDGSIAASLRLKNGKEHFEGASEHAHLPLREHMRSLMKGAHRLSVTAANGFHFQHKESDTGGTKFPRQVDITAHHPETGDEAGRARYYPPKRKGGPISIDEVRGHVPGAASALLNEIEARHPTSSTKFLYEVKKNNNDPDKTGHSHERAGKPSDWDTHYPNLSPTIYRGISVRLPHRSARVVNSSSPKEAHLDELHDAITQGSSLGPHWTEDEAAARQFAHNSVSDYRTDVPVVLHAKTPSRKDIETREQHLYRGGVFPYGDPHSKENEIPIRKGRKVSVTGVSWRPDADHPDADETGWIHHTYTDLDQRHHTAMAHEDQEWPFSLFEVTASDDDDSYRMQHQAPIDYGAPLHDVESMLPDFYTHPHYYNHGQEHFHESASVIHGARGNPEKKVRVYRALPAEHAHKGIRTGDWVTTSLSYARLHAQEGNGPEDHWPVIRATVPAKHLMTEGDVHEWGYAGPPKEYPMIAHKGGYNQEIRNDAEGKIVRVKRRPKKEAAENAVPRAGCSAEPVPGAYERNSTSLGMPSIRGVLGSALAAVDGPDWCRHRSAGNCWWPGHNPLGVPQARGRCPWETRYAQQVCPISDPGPGADMARKGTKEIDYTKQSVGDDWKYDNNIHGQTNITKPDGSTETFYHFLSPGIKNVRHPEHMPLPLYHGTSRVIPEGSQIEPGHPGNFVKRMKHVYATDSPDEAKNYAGPNGHVYEVKPTGWYGHRSDARGHNWASEYPFDVVRLHSGPAHQRDAVLVRQARETNSPLLPVKHAGYAGFVEAYPGHHDEMKEVDANLFPGEHDGFDEDLHEETAPMPHPHEQAHHDQHGDYPDSYYERHDEAYSKALRQRQEDEAPVGHHTPLVNFIQHHIANHELWQNYGALRDVPLHHVYATQPHVVQKHLDKYTADPRAKTHQVQEYGRSPATDRIPANHAPLFVQHEGNTFAIEGHHRTAAAMRRGDSHIRGFVFDADKHGWPAPPEGEEHDVYEGGSRLEKYARGRRPVDCDYPHRNPLYAAAHALYHHDDGVCTATERRRAREVRGDSGPASRKQAARVRRIAAQVVAGAVERVGHNDPSCRVCQGVQGTLVHTATPVPAPFPNPHAGRAERGGSTWFHGTSFDPSESIHHEDDEYEHGRAPHPGGTLARPDTSTSEYGERQEHHWNTDLGVHFSSHHEVAQEFADRGDPEHSRVAHVHLHMANPIHFKDEDEFANHAIDHAKATGKHFLPKNPQAHKDFRSSDWEEKMADHVDHGYEYLNENDYMAADSRKAISSIDRGDHRKHGMEDKETWLTRHPDREEIAESYVNHLRSKGHDGVIYGNSHEGPTDHPCAIAFDDTPVHIKKWVYQNADRQARHEQETSQKHEPYHYNPHQLEFDFTKQSALDPEFHFHFTAAWADVRNKAKRIRSEGGVRIAMASSEGVAGEVRGDNAIYEAMITYVPGSARVGAWSCGCRWAAYAWGRSPVYRRFEGRMCSHALALQFEAQSRGAYGRTVAEDVDRPGWLKAHSPVVIQHQRDKSLDLTRRAVPPGNMRRMFNASSNDFSGSGHPDSIYLRFGDWSKDERSENKVTGFREDGVSAYDLNRHGEPMDPDPDLNRGHTHDQHCEPDCDLDADNDDYGNDTLEEMHGRVRRAEQGRRRGQDLPSERPHLIKGDMVGIGHDGEPLLKNVRRVGDWIDHRHHFFPDAEPHHLARSSEDEGYRPPPQRPRRHVFSAWEAPSGGAGLVASSVLAGGLGNGITAFSAWEVPADGAVAGETGSMVDGPFQRTATPREHFHMDVQRAMDNAREEHEQAHQDDAELAETYEPLKHSDLPEEHHAGWRFHRNAEPEPLANAFAELFGPQKEHQHHPPVPVTQYKHPSSMEPLHLDEQGGSYRRHYEWTRPDAQIPEFKGWSGPHSAKETLATHPTWSQSFGPEGQRQHHMRTHQERLQMTGTDPTEAHEDVVLRRNRKLTEQGWGVVSAKQQPDHGVFWHGSPSGDLRGGEYGLHVGTQEAARQALTARIGHPAEGEWDGTREYGKTLLAGHKRLQERGVYPTGYNAGQAEDHYPTGHATYGDGTPIPMHVKPDIFPVRIKGEMSNSPDRPHEDFRANGYMKAQIARGRARRGYFYTNEGEDSGSVSAVVPNGEHLERLPRNARTAASVCPECHGPVPPGAGRCPHCGALLTETIAPEEHLAAKAPKPPSVAGVVLKALDTGRILMLQRGNEDLKDPARGCWEFPGGHAEDGDRHSLDTAVREWEEEVGQPFPEGGTVVHTWTSPSGVYQGHVVVIPEERSLVMSNGRVLPNPDDPKGDQAEQAAWWEIDHAKKNPALRPEVKTGTPWKDLERAGDGMSKAARSMYGLGYDGRIAPGHEQTNRMARDESLLGSTISLVSGQVARRELMMGEVSSVAPGLDEGTNLFDFAFIAVDESAQARIERLRAERDQRNRQRQEQTQPRQQTREDVFSKFFTPIPQHELDEHRRQREQNKPKPEPIDSRSYSLDDVSSHYGWEGFDAHEISHLVHQPERAQFSLEHVPVHSLRVAGEHGIEHPVSYHDIAGQDEDEQERLRGLEHGYEQGHQIPPIVVVRHGDHHLIADGSHRAAIHAERGETHVPAFVTDRTKFEKTADLSAMGPLNDFNGEGVREPPAHSNSANPASTGFATSEDPSNWEHPEGMREELRVGMLHDTPEPALPSTDGERDESLPSGTSAPTSDAGTMQYGYDDLTEFGEDHPEVRTGALELADPRLSTAEIVAKFQATAGGQKLQGAKQEDQMDIAAAARAHLAGMPVTAAAGQRKEALKSFTFPEQQELINEGIHADARARNFEELQIEGTHYAALAEELANGEHEDDTLIV